MPRPSKSSPDKSPVKGQFTVIGEDVSFGDGSCVWNLVYIGSRVTIGPSVTIGFLVHIGSDVTIGKGTLIEGGAYIPDLTRIGQNYFIGPNVTVTNDPFPPIRRSTGTRAWVPVDIGDDAIIGAGASLRAGITVGTRAVIGMGAVVIADVPEETVVAGNPARPLFTREEYDRKQRDFAASKEGKIRD